MSGKRGLAVGGVTTATPRECPAIYVKIGVDMIANLMERGNGSTNLVRYPRI